MSQRAVSVVVAPWGTLEAECLGRLLQSVDIRAVEAVDTDTVAAIIAVPRPEHPSTELLDRMSKSAVPMLLLVDEVDALTIALTQSSKAAGHLSLRSSGPSIVKAVRAVAMGRPALERRRASRDPFDALTERERTVMQHVASGRSDDDIANQLQISSHTVRSHVQSAMAKLDVNHRHAAAALVRNSSTMVARATGRGTTNLVAGLP